MKSFNLDVLIVKNENKLKRYSKTFKTDEPLTIENIKNVVKGEIEFPHEIVKEQFFYMSGELKEGETAPIKSGNQFILTIK
jgi:hypothetical protein